VSATAAALLGLEFVRHPLSQSEAEIVARKCHEYTARMGYDSHTECENTPIFASGSDVPEATNHDIEALAGQPRWVLLNYEYGTTKPGRGWQQCAESYDITVEQCDEYPFFSTEQGGPLATPTPHVKVIDRMQNERQGGMYGQFATNVCRLRTGTPQAGANSVGGDLFLGVPLPPGLGVPTWYGCKTRPSP